MTETDYPPTLKAEHEAYKELGDAVYDACWALGFMSDELSSLARSLIVTGNESLAERLDHFADVLEKHAAPLQKAYSRHLGAMCAESEASAHRLFLGVFKLMTQAPQGDSK